MSVNEALIYFHREKSELFGPPYFGLVRVVCLKNNRIDIDNCLKEKGGTFTHTYEWNTETYLLPNMFSVTETKLNFC